MIKAFVLLAAVAFITLPTAAQDRPRFFDNFDTLQGVQVHRPLEFMPIAAKNKATAVSTRIAPDKKLLRKTSHSRMNVSDSLALRETLRANYKGLAMATGRNMRGFTTGDLTVDSYIVNSSLKYGIDPLLIYAQMHQESSFKVRALSHKGASGLMQLMPATARRLGVTNIYDPKQNIDGGVKYMRMLLDMFRGDVNLALAGYNAGEGAVMKYGNQIPPYNETREYVRRISARYLSISDGTITRTVQRLSDTQAAKLEQKESRPLTVYEPDPVAIKLADGRMRLVNQ